MRYVAQRVRIPSLIASATATAPADPENETNAISLTGGAGTFQISSGVFQAPDRLYVKKDSSTTNYGTPYEFLEYHHFLDLKSMPRYARIGITVPNADDIRPTYSYTITPSNKIWAQPLTQSNVLTLFYRISPAAYSGAATPEIMPLYDHILTMGAEIALKEWLREPNQIIPWWSLFSALDPQIELYDSAINSGRKRKHLRIHKSYKPQRS